jgi:hypothetical protein
MKRPVRPLAGPTGTTADLGEGGLPQLAVRLDRRQVRICGLVWGWGARPLAGPTSGADLGEGGMPQLAVALDRRQMRSRLAWGWGARPLAGPTGTTADLGEGGLPQLAVALDRRQVRICGLVWGWGARPLAGPTSRAGGGGERQDRSGRQAKGRGQSRQVGSEGMIVPDTCPGRVGALCCSWLRRGSAVL